MDSSRLEHGRSFQKERKAGEEGQGSHFPFDLPSENEKKGKKENKKYFLDFFCLI